MKRSEFHSIDGKHTNKLNWLMIAFGILAICITGFCYTAHLQNKNNHVIKYVNRAEPYSERI
ncbi:hypothetical protein [Anaerosacchariphilus polymeriproducens]|uniref:Uncharacterized protein n=1 Tax=Anaerosacchariphilus polymeriproducens TaxID=1812858 RepID=A0A371AWK8_9FIRM|nr:hypothetical protein [Anaerosacchariphilus polymeriproducens]RDU23919.1 hypothetical protein DWV06_06390 [Anaerosacchariphilus polymeriproducens]